MEYQNGIISSVKAVNMMAQYLFGSLVMMHRLQSLTRKEIVVLLKLRFHIPACFS